MTGLVLSRRHLPWRVKRDRNFAAPIDLLAARAVIYLQHRNPQHPKGYELLSITQLPTHGAPQSSDQSPSSIYIHFRRVSDLGTGFITPLYSVKTSSVRTLLIAMLTIIDPESSDIICLDMLTGKIFQDMD